jgi:hypothetical protein
MTVRRGTHYRNLPDGHKRETQSGTSGEQSPLLTQRAALIFIAALAIGVTAGILTYLAGTRPADAVLAGGASCAAAIALLNNLIA